MTSDSASRVTRSRRSLRRAIALFAIGCALAGLLRAQESDPAAKPGPSAATPAEVETDQADAGSKPAESGSKPADAVDKPAKSGPSPGRFEPTEKVRADFDVSFPVDI